MEKVTESLSSDLTRFASEFSLTPREMDIVKLLLDKTVSVESIAKKLGVSPNTVKNHFQKIFQKTKTNAKAELLAVFVQFIVTGDRTPELSAGGAQMTILLADDDANFAELMANAFEKLEHSVELKTVRDGVEVLGYIESAAAGNAETPLPNLILLDLRMPRMDGYEVLRQLKENATTQHVPVIAISGSDDPQDIEKIYKLGGSSYLRKPSKFQTLVSKMDALATFWGNHSESPRSLPR